jgi:FG-GAP-like repeat
LDGSANNRAPDHSLTQLSDGSLVVVWQNNLTFSDVYGRKLDVGVVIPNTAPMLKDAPTPVLAAESEDSRAPVGAVGTLVGTLVDLDSSPGGLDNVTDPDAGAQTGIAVTAVTIPAGTPTGAWWYSTDDGVNWSQMGTVSDTSARLLAADASTRVYFQPSADFNGTITDAITFKAWDRSLGVNGSTLNTTLYNTFSTQTDTADLTINPVNDAPTLTVTGANTFAEGNAPVLVLNAASIADVENDPIKGATVTIADFVVGDELKINGVTTGDTGANIHFIFSGNVLTLTGEDTFQNYQDALKLVTFEATSLDPSAGGTRPTAHIDFRVSTETPLGPSDALFTRYLPDVDAVSPVQGFAETPRAILLDDLDGDGKNDLIIADSDATSGFRFNLVVQHGNGDGTFSSPQTYEIGQNLAVDDRPVSMVLGHFDSDASLDLAITSSVSNQVFVFLGDGSGGFMPSPWPSASPPPGYSTGNKPAALATADYDSDGFADLIVANVDDSSPITLLKGNGAGGFSQAGSLQVGTSTGVRSIAAADLNGDFNVDIIAVDDLNEAAVFFGDGTGQFSDGLGNAGSARTYAVGSTPSAVAVADLNGDGRPDIVVANAGSDDLSVLLQAADHSFGPAGAYAAGTEPSALSVGDLNGDGFLDLAVANNGSSDVSVLLGNGNGTFQLATAYGVRTNPRAVVIADIDNNGGLDIATANLTGHSVSVLINNTSSFSRVEHATVVIDALNNKPDVTGPTQLPGAANVPITVTGVSFADPDGGTGQETVTFTATIGTFAAFGGGGVSVDDTNPQALQLVGTIADLNAFMTAGNLSFTTSAADTIGVTIDDNAHTGSVAESDSTTISVVLNAAPVVTPTNPATPVSFTERAGPVVIDDQIVVSDSDNPPGLAEVTVTISSGFTPGDVLAADASGTLLTADYDTSTHALTISGTGTLLDYQTVLRRVTFDNPEDAGNPLAGHNPTNFGASTSRIFTFVADDGSVDSADATTTIDVFGINETPELSGIPSSITFNENTNLFLASGAASPFDVDSIIQGGTVKILNGLTSDRLATSPTSGINSSFNPNTGTLTFSSSGTSSNYTTFLNSIRYFNTVFDDPSNGGANPTRTIEWKINDGSLTSTTQTEIVTINAINDAPVVSVANSSQVGAEDTDLSITGLSIVDPDLAGGSIEATLAVGHGTLNVSTVANGASVSDNNSGSVRLTGTLAKINTTLATADAIVYHPTQDYHGSDTLSVTVDDKGNTGSDPGVPPAGTGGPNNEEGSGTVDLTVTSINDEPSGVDNTIVTDEDTAYTFKAADFGFTDPIDERGQDHEPAGRRNPEQ